MMMMIKQTNKIFVKTQKPKNRFKCHWPLIAWLKNNFCQPVGLIGGFFLFAENKAYLPNDNYHNFFLLCLPDVLMFVFLFLVKNIMRTKRKKKIKTHSYLMNERIQIRWVKFVCHCCFLVKCKFSFRIESNTNQFDEWWMITQMLII